MATALLGIGLNRLSVFDTRWAVIGTVWQVHATIIGLSFVVIVFLLEVVARSNLVEGVLKRFLRSSFVLPVLVYSLVGSLTIGVLYLYPAFREWISPNHASAFFMLTILGILFVYYKIVNLILADPTEEQPYDILKRNITADVFRVAQIQRYDEILAGELPEDAEIEAWPTPAGANATVVTADDLGLNGTIVDIYCPLFVKGVSELVRSEMVAESEDEENGTAAKVTVKIKVGTELEGSSPVLQVDREGLDLATEEVYPYLAGSILTRSVSYSRDPAIYEYTDYIDREGKRIVRNAEQRAFREYLKRFEAVVQHSVKEVIRHQVLDTGNQYRPGNIPMYNLDRILVRVYEQTLEERNREFAEILTSVLANLLTEIEQNDVYPAYDKLATVFSRLYLMICIHRENLSQVSTISAVENLIKEFRGVSLRAEDKDLEDFEELEIDYWTESYALSCLEELHKMLKYALEAHDQRSFAQLWRAVGYPDTDVNPSVAETLRAEQEKVLFSSGALAFIVAKDRSDHTEMFQAVYDQCIHRHYRELPHLLDVYRSMTEEDRRPPQWTRWSRQEEDVIQQMYGKPMRLNRDIELREFYCFVGILNTHVSDFIDENPLSDKSIQTAELNDIKTTIQRLKRKPPLLEVNEFVDRADFEEQADQFLEYHEEITVSE